MRNLFCIDELRFFVLPPYVKLFKLKKLNKYKIFCKDKTISSAMQIWVVNPYDQIPNESDLALRYWSLCRTFAEQGHNVIWWSSDFSHRHKIKRKACDVTDGFAVRLVETPPYKKNISLARIRNHKIFAESFYRDAVDGVKSGELEQPDRIIVSLPPLGVAESAFKIRDWINNKEYLNSKDEKSSYHSKCEVTVDIMDAWPEAFYRLLPKPLRLLIGPTLFASLHRSAQRSYQHADKISGVGQSYIDLAQSYLKVQYSGSSTAETTQNNLKSMGMQKHFHLCYHGTDMARFESIIDTAKVSKEKNVYLPLSKKGLGNLRSGPLRAVYIGAMGNGYDLQTLIGVAERWKSEGILPFQIHFAGKGPQLDQLKERCRVLGLIETVSELNDNLNTPPVFSLTTPVVFHGFLKKDAVNKLLLTSDVALVTNRPETLVACPYKAGEYAAAGLPIISCLGGELGRLLSDWNSGSDCTEGDTASLYNAFKQYYDDKDLLQEQSLNARKMAEKNFDREKTYAEFTKFILNSEDGEKKPSDILKYNHSDETL